MTILCTLLFCFISLLINRIDADVSAHRVFYIDKFVNASAHTNYIFRGNEPTNKTTLDYDRLVSTMRTNAREQANITLPSFFTITDLSFLNVLEFPDTAKEKNFWKAHPKLGNYINWPIVGDLFSPDSVPKWAREFLAKNLGSWQFDNLPVTIPDIHSLLTKPFNSSNVVYMHCEAGEDRTGEISGSYYMKYLKWSFHKALAFDNHVETRDISKFSRNAFQWYCYYLKYTDPDYSHEDCSIPKSFQLDDEMDSYTDTSDGDYDFLLNSVRALDEDNEINRGFLLSLMYEAAETMRELRDRNVA